MENSRISKQSQVPLQEIKEVSMQDEENQEHSKYIINFDMFQKKQHLNEQIEQIQILDQDIPLENPEEENYSNINSIDNSALLRLKDDQFNNHQDLQHIHKLDHVQQTKLTSKSRIELSVDIDENISQRSSSTIQRIGNKKKELPQLSVSIVRSDLHFTNRHNASSYQFQQNIVYKFRMIVRDMYSNSQKELYIKSNYEVRFGRKKHMEDFEQISYEGYDYVNLKNKCISLEEHARVVLNPQVKMIFTIQDQGSFTGTYLKLDEAEIELRSHYRVGNSSLYIHDLDPELRVMRLVVNSGPYKGQKRDLDFTQADFYYIGSDQQQENLINFENDVDINPIHCKIYYKEKYGKFFIKSYGEQNDLWFRLKEARETSDVSVNTTDNCCFMVGNAYKVYLNWK